MKLHSVISAVVLGTASLVQAQTSPAPQAPKPALRLTGEGGSGAELEPKQNGFDPNSGNRMETLILKAGPLREVAAQVERCFKDDPKKPDVDLPNLVYAKDTRDAVVPGELTLRRVTPVQALALVAAAADCALEPIFAPAESAEGNGMAGSFGAGKAQPIIGYRIVLASAVNRRPSPAVQELTELARQLDKKRSSFGENHPEVVALRERIKHLEVESVGDAGPLSGVGIALVKKGDGVVVGQVIPGSPASFLLPSIQPGQRILSVADAGKEDVDVTGLGLEKVVQLVRGAPGTSVKITFGADTDKGPTKQVVSLMRANLPIPPPDRMLPQVKMVETISASLTPSSFDVFAEPAGNQRQNHRPFVRVYALGSIFTGSTQEIGDKQHRFENLVRDAVEQSGPDADFLFVDESSPKAAGTPNAKVAAVKQATPKTQPEFSFHYETRALVVRATAGQHAIVEQIIKALKENAAQPASSRP